jgi:predicted dehydrogenase
MVQAAEKHNRLVQVGMQRRSNTAWIAAIGKLHAGLIGDVYLARSWYANLRGTIGADEFIDAPEHLDYERWQGPAPRRPYSKAVVPYNWHWRWHWGNGEVGNNGVHTLDLCRWGLDTHLPQETVSIGGRYAFDDAQETPDTNTVSFKFEHNKSATWECTSCNRHDHGFVTFYGLEGTLEIDADGANRHFDRSDKLVAEAEGSPHSLRDHIANFLDCIRNERAADDLNANIAIGHESALLCHLANISYRVGRLIQSDPSTGKIKHDPAAMDLWRRTYAADRTPVV